MAILRIYRGDVFRRPVTILDTDGLAFDLTNCTLIWTLKRSTDSAANDADAIAQLSWIDQGASVGITVDDPLLGVAVVTLGATSTATLSPIERYVFDLQVTDENGEPTTVDSGVLLIKRDGTRTTAP